MKIETLQPKERIEYSNGEILYLQDNSFMKFNIMHLKKLSILTTDQGPIMDDVAIAMFFDEDFVLVLPSEHSCYSSIYEAFSNVLTLDYQKVINAMSYTENAEFILWERP